MPPAVWHSAGVPCLLLGWLTWGRSPATLVAGLHPATGWGRRVFFKGDAQLLVMMSSSGMSSSTTAKGCERQQEDIRQKIATLCWSGFISHPDVQDLSRINETPPARTEAEEQADEQSCVGRSEEFASRLHFRWFHYVRKCSKGFNSKHNHFIATQGLQLVSSCVSWWWGCCPGLDALLRALQVIFGGFDAGPAEILPMLFTLWP